MSSEGRSLSCQRNYHITGLKDCGLFDVSYGRWIPFNKSYYKLFIEEIFNQITSSWVKGWFEDRKILCSNAQQPHRLYKYVYLSWRQLIIEHDEFL